MELLGITIGSVIGMFIAVVFLYFVFRVSVDIPLAERHRFVMVLMVYFRNCCQAIWRNYGGFILGLSALAVMIIIADILDNL